MKGLPPPSVHLVQIHSEGPSLNLGLYLSSRWEAASDSFGAVHTLALMGTEFTSKIGKEIPCPSSILPKGEGTTKAFKETQDTYAKHRVLYVEI